MEDLEESIKDVLLETFDTLNNKSIEMESILGLYYIKLHLNNNCLSNENRFIVDKIFFLLQKNEYEKYFLSDIRFLITWYLIRSIKDASLEKEIIEEFFSVYLVFDNFQNIIDNKDIIQMIYPQDKLEEYLEELYKAIRKRENFFDLELLDKEKIIFKYHYMTVMMYERNEKSFKKMYDDLYKIFLEAIEKKDDDVVFYIYSPLQFSWNSISTTCDENKFFNDSVEKLLELYIKENMIEKYKIQSNNTKLDKNKPIKVAFLQERMINYSIFKVFYSVLKALNDEENKNYEFIILNLNFTELGGSSPEVEKFTKELGFEYINCHEILMEENTPFYSVVTKSLELRDFILKKKIDILVGMHSRPEYNFLFTTRTCPIQIYWSHGNYEYDIDGIDKRIKHGDFKVKEINHGKFLFAQFGDILDEQYLNPKIDRLLINEERRKYPDNTVILGTIGRLSKVDSTEYIKVIDEVLTQNINTIYIAAGSGDALILKNKIKKENLDRWFFPGHVNPHLYGHIIDIWPNTFPNPQGMSTVEFMAKGKPVLTMKNEFHNFEEQEKYNQERIDKFKKFKMNTKDNDEYKRSLELLIQKSEAREIIGKMILESIKKNYYNSSDCVKRFIEILEEG